MKKLILILNTALLLGAGNLFAAAGEGNPDRYGIGKNNGILITPQHGGWNKFKEERLEKLRLLGLNRSVDEERDYQALVRERSGGNGNNLQVQNQILGNQQVQHIIQPATLNAPNSTTTTTTTKRDNWNKFKEERLEKLRLLGLNRSVDEERDYQALVKERGESNLKGTTTTKNIEAV
jgi:hypothetical protein